MPAGQAISYPLLSTTPYFYIYEHAVFGHDRENPPVTTTTHISNNNNVNDKDDKSTHSTEKSNEQSVKAAAEESVIGVKLHTSKKSNAVGDPDNDDSDDEDDDDDYDDITDEDWEMEFVPD